MPLSDDELRFIGWVMTDGTINKHTRGITITQGEHQPWLEQIQSCIDGCGLKATRSVRIRRTKFRQTSNSVMWTISHGKPRGTKKHLRGWGHLEPFMDKNFSSRLFDCDARQFSILLEAIHMGDGAKQSSAKGWTRRSYHISTGNRTFADRLQRLAVLRGWRANIAMWMQKNPIWMIHLKNQPWVRVGGITSDRPQWIVEGHTDEECWCVQNELGTLVTRRNGMVAIVGNCQMVGRGTRIAEHKDDLLLLDLLWMHEKHKLSRPAHLIAKTDEEADEITAQLQANGGGAEDLEGAAGSARL